MTTATGAISPTEIKLLATFKAPIMRLESICSEYLGMGYDRAKELAALNQLAVPTFRIGDSQKAPLLVSTMDLAEYLDNRNESARASWVKSQL